MAGVVTVEEAIRSLFLQATGTSSGTTDALNSVKGAFDRTSDSTTRLLNALGGAAALTNVAASNLQTLQGFAGSSPEALALSTKVAKSTGYLGVAVGLVQIGLQVFRDEDHVRTNTALSTIGATLGVIAAGLSSPLLVAGLSIASAGFLVAGVMWNENANFTDSLASLKSVINNYVNSLEPNAQDEFKEAFISSTVAMLSGGMMVPQVNSSGQITSFSIDIPTTIAPQRDGSTLYTFDSGITLKQQSGTMPGPLQTSASVGDSIWTIPQGGANHEIISGFADGSHATSFRDDAGNSVAEVYIAGNGGA